MTDRSAWVCIRSPRWFGTKININLFVSPSATKKKFIADDNHNKVSHLIIKTVVGLIGIIEKLWKNYFLEVKRRLSGSELMRRMIIAVINCLLTPKSFQAINHWWHFRFDTCLTSLQMWLNMLTSPGEAFHVFSIRRLHPEWQRGFISRANVTEERHWLILNDEMKTVIFRRRHLQY